MEPGRDQLRARPLMPLRGRSPTQHQLCGGGSTSSSNARDGRPRRAVRARAPSVRQALLAAGVPPADVAKVTEMNGGLRPRTAPHSPDKENNGCDSDDDWPGLVDEPLR